MTTQPIPLSLVSFCLDCFVPLRLKEEGVADVLYECHSCRKVYSVSSQNHQHWLSMKKRVDARLDVLDTNPSIPSIPSSDLVKGLTSGLSGDPRLGLDISGELDDDLN